MPQERLAQFNSRVFASQDSIPQQPTQPLVRPILSSELPPVNPWNNPHNPLPPAQPTQEIPVVNPNIQPPTQAPDLFPERNLKYTPPGPLFPGH
jgi:hypothetical protein